MLRTSGDDAYNDWIMEVSVAAGSKLNSVRTILFNRAEAAAEAEVLVVLRGAEAIFLAGGDQSEYLAYWRDTQVQSILQVGRDAAAVYVVYVVYVILLVHHKPLLSLVCRIRPPQSLSEGPRQAWRCSATGCTRQTKAQWTLRRPWRARMRGR